MYERKLWKNSRRPNSNSPGMHLLSAMIKPIYQKLHDDPGEPDGVSFGVQNKSPR